MLVELQQTIKWYKVGKEESSFVFVSVCLSNWLSLYLSLSLVTGSIMGNEDWAESFRQEAVSEYG